MERHLAATVSTRSFRPTAPRSSGKNGIRTSVWGQLTPARTRRCPKVAPPSDPAFAQLPGRHPRGRVGGRATNPRDRMLEAGWGCRVIAINTDTQSPAGDGGGSQAADRTGPDAGLSSGSTPYWAGIGASRYDEIKPCSKCSDMVFVRGPRWRTGQAPLLWLPR